MDLKTAQVTTLVGLDNGLQDGNADKAKFSYPRDIVLSHDASFALCVGESNRVIRKIVLRRRANLAVPKKCVTFVPLRAVAPELSPMAGSSPAVVAVSYVL